MAIEKFLILSLFWSLMSINNNKSDKDELLVELVRGVYDEENQRTRDLDSKAASLIGYVTITTGLLIGLGTISLIEKVTSAYLLGLYIASIGLFLVSIIVSLVAIMIRNYESSPTFEQLILFFNHYQYYTEIVAQIIPSLIQITKKNSILNDNKAKCIIICWMLIILAICLIVAFTVGYLMQSNKPKNEISITIEGLDKNNLRPFHEFLENLQSKWVK